MPFNYRQATRAKPLLSAIRRRNANRAVDDQNQVVALEQKHSKSASKILYLSGMFVADETIPCGTKVPPGAKFKKVWRVRNTGTKAWNSRTTLKYCWGNTDLEPQGKVKGTCSRDCITITSLLIHGVYHVYRSCSAATETLAGKIINSDGHLHN